MKVDFILIGAHKAGTTSLAYYLAQHSKICFSSIKEPHFFTQTNPEIQTLAQYEKLFNPQPGQILGEASINCTMPKRASGTEQRIFDYNPNIKLIYLVRDPVQRIASAYRYRYMNNWIKKPVTRMEQEILAGDYLAVSNYFRQIQPYLNLFNRNQIHFCLYEQMVADPASFMSGVLKFLEIGWEKQYQEVSFYVNKKRSRDEKGLNAAGRFVSQTRIAALFPRPWVQQIKNLFLNKISDVPGFSNAFSNELRALLKEDMLMFQKISDLNLSSWGF